MGLSASVRAMKFVKYLPDFGWQPVVLTITPPKYFATDESLVAELQNPHIELTRTPTRAAARLARKPKEGFEMPPEKSLTLLGKLRQTLAFPEAQAAWKSLAVAQASDLIEKHKDIALIFSSAPPFTAHLVAVELRKKYRLPIVLDWREPWVENPLQFYATAVQRRMLEAAEEQVISAADKLITVNRTIKELLLKKHFGKLTHQQFSIIPHGADAEDFARAKPDVRADSKLRFLYSGVFRDTMSPKPFFTGLKLAFEKQPELRDRIEARFVGVLSKEHIKSATAMGVERNIEVRGFKPHLETLQENMKADVLWATLDEIPGNETITPAKLFEYAACGKTLFGIVPEGGAKLIVQEANGVTAHPAKPDEIAEKILDLARLWKTQQLPVCPPELAARYDSKTLAHHLSKEFENLLSIE